MNKIREFLQLENITPVAQALPDEIILEICDYVSPSIKDLINLNKTLPNYLKFCLKGGGMPGFIGEGKHPLDEYNSEKDYNIFDLITPNQLLQIDNIIQIAPLFYKLCDKGRASTQRKHSLEMYTSNEQFSTNFRCEWAGYDPKIKLVHMPSYYIERSSVALAFMLLGYPYETSNEDRKYIRFKIKDKRSITKKQMNEYLKKHKLPPLLYRSGKRVLPHPYCPGKFISAALIHTL